MDVALSGAMSTLCIGFKESRPITRVCVPCHRHRYFYPPPRKSVSPPPPPLCVHMYRKTRGEKKVHTARCSRIRISPSPFIRSIGMSVRLGRVCVGGWLVLGLGRNLTGGSIAGIEAM